MCDVIIERVRRREKEKWNGRKRSYKLTKIYTARIILLLIYTIYIVEGIFLNNNTRFVAVSFGFWDMQFWNVIILVIRSVWNYTPDRQIDRRVVCAASATFIYITRALKCRRSRDRHYRFHRGRDVPFTAHLHTSIAADKQRRYSNALTPPRRARPKGRQPDVSRLSLPYLHLPMPVVCSLPHPPSPSLPLTPSPALEKLGTRSSAPLLSPFASRDRASAHRCFPDLILHENFRRAYIYIYALLFVAHRVLGVISNDFYAVKSRRKINDPPALGKGVYVRGNFYGRIFALRLLASRLFQAIRKD